MSDETVAFSISIGGVEKNVSSIKEIKDAIKDLQKVVESADIGSEQFKKASADLEKLNDSLKEVTKTNAQRAKEQQESAKASEESIKSLTQSLKGLISQQANVKYGTKEWHELAKAINDTEGKIGDLKDGFSTLRGSGVERTASSLSLLKEGFANFDFDKIKLGFKGLGAAMQAVPIFFLIQGIQYLLDNFDKVVAIFTPVNFGLNKMTKEFESLQKITSLLGDELKREIDILEAQGASSEKILAKKKELVKIQINEAQASINLRMEKIKEVLMNDSVTESIDKTVAALYSFLQP